MRICLLCVKTMDRVESASVDSPFATFVCRDCRKPNKTFYKEIYDTAQKKTISDHFLLDKFYVSRYFLYGKTRIEKDIVGFLDTTPISLFEPACEVKSIIIFNFNNLDKVKTKLNTYVLLS